MEFQLKEYRRRLLQQDEENIHLLPWGGVVIRNCDDEGRLTKYKSVKDYRDGDKPLWVLQPLVLFRENGNIY